MPTVSTRCPGGESRRSSEESESCSRHAELLYYRRQLKMSFWFLFKCHSLREISPAHCLLPPYYSPSLCLVSFQARVLVCNCVLHSVFVVCLPLQAAEPQGRAAPAPFPTAEAGTGTCLANKRCSVHVCWLILLQSIKWFWKSEDKSTDGEFGVWVAQQTPERMPGKAIDPFYKPSPDVSVENEAGGMRCPPGSFFSSPFPFPWHFCCACAPVHPLSTRKD